MPFLLIRNDIAKVRVDAIVNPANEELLEGSGTSRAIYLAAGEERLAGACEEIGHCDLGKAVITKAFDLPAKYVIHAVGPVWIDGSYGEKKLLYNTYIESLKLANAYHLESVAFPLLSSGNYGYPKAEALNVAISAISDFLLEHEMTVYMVLYDDETVSVSRRLFASIEEYIDDHYVQSKDEQIPGDENYPEFAKREFQEKYCVREDSSVYVTKTPVKRSLDCLMEHMDETFSEMLLRLIDERNLKDSYVYKKANIDRRHFSKIRNDKHYAPNKKTVLAFAIALELSIDETKDLLMRAGFALSVCSKSDVIISYFIEKKEYDIFKINEMLFAYEQPILYG
jgi:O-acetyl-ADP-ribose deacetylase (regulator of RNase III)